MLTALGPGEPKILLDLLNRVIKALEPAGKVGHATEGDAVPVPILRGSKRQPTPAGQPGVATLPFLDRSFP